MKTLLRPKTLSYWKDADRKTMFRDSTVQGILSGLPVAGILLWFGLSFFWVVLGCAVGIAVHFDRAEVAQDAQRRYYANLTGFLYLTVLVCMAFGPGLVLPLPKP